MEQFFEQTLKDNKHIIIDFWAPWCGPCRVFGPIFEAAAKKHLDVHFVKINVDEQPEIAANFGVRSIPTVVAIKDQTVLFNQPGALREQDLNALIGEIRAHPDI